MFALITTTGILFSYSVSIPDRSQMQLVELTISSPFTENATVVMTNVASLAMVGKSIEQTLIEHVEHYERIALRNASEGV
jgi:hypothetical protein